MIGVIGASHSAILAILNLFNLATNSSPSSTSTSTSTSSPSSSPSSTNSNNSSPSSTSSTSTSTTPSHPNIRIKWFTRHPLRYAEYKNGWILYDNTGLKGIAAEFARDQLESNRLPVSEAGRFITHIDCSSSGGGDRGKELNQFKTHLPTCDFVVQAIGFTRDQLPILSSGDHHGLISPQFDHCTGRFHHGNGSMKEIPGLFGAGIAFPERVTDPYGNVEYAVGFWKFMGFIRRVCPEWVGV